ncbi:MAG: CbiX/SirB N-terminal domain-containing protein [Defluviicoccus sp.]|nr:CbiX/SirB N-terminal domain-containing protein [Defluviicoccus sp.]MDG4608265.1 CbiX/SirB N-terminal domain-containing protein [Defluviicoccus sp.]
MSSTRSDLRLAAVSNICQALTVNAAVILVGHGSPRVSRPAADLNRIALALRQREGFAAVEVAMLNGSGGRPADVFARVAADRAVVVPIMMCDGQTVHRDIPHAFADIDPARLTFCPPVGTHPRLAALITKRASVAAHRMGTLPENAVLLLIAHGSTRNAASEQATLLQARRLAEARVFRAVAAAYLEQPPSIADTLEQLQGPVIAVGLFAAAGRHATHDVDEALAAAGRADVTYLGPIGTDPGIAALVASLVRACAGAGGAEAMGRAYLPDGTA